MKTKVFLWLGLIALLLRIIVSFVVWHPDLNNHMDWGVRFFEYGSKEFYAPSSNVWSYTWPNQPPGTIYMFAGIKILFDFIFNIFWQININIPAFPSIIVSYFETNLYPALLKLPAILADFGIAYLIFLVIKQLTINHSTKKAVLGALVWLINPVVWYNSSVWGQYDSVINFFALLSFYLLIQKKLTYSLLAIALSLYIKVSLLIFVPIWLIVALKQKYCFRLWLKSITISLVVIVLFTAPFADKNAIVWLYDLYTSKIFVQQLHVITANAFNVWATIAGIHERPDSLPFLGLTYQIWGYILFSTSYIFVISRLLRSQITNPKSLTTNLVWSLALIAFASFVLLTNMHERYLYPLFPYLTILFGLSSVSSFLYFLISLIGLLNLYNFWFTPKVDLLVTFLSFGDRLMPRVLGIFMFLLFLMLSKKYNSLKI